LKDPQTVEVGARRTPAETVKHVTILLLTPEARSVERFARPGSLRFRDRFLSPRRIRADHGAHWLKKNNHAVAVLHSNRTQRETRGSIEGFS